MANLIEYIQSQIYENSTEDISGSIMQQVLTRMASDEGVVNVHTISGQTPFADYNNAQAARDAVPAGFKKLGLIITYKLSSGWYIDEFIGSATSGWSTASNWKCLGPISVSQNASTGKTTITIGSESFDVATQPVSVSQNTQTIEIGGEEVGALGGIYEGENPEYIAVWVDSNRKILFGINHDGNFYFGAGCPQQIKDYVLTHKAEIDAQLATKVDKVTGKSLIDEDVASSLSAIENPEWLSVTLDSEGKILWGVNADGEKVEYLPTKTPVGKDYFINNPEWLKLIVDKDGKVIGGIKTSGEVYIGQCNITKEITERIDNDISYNDKFQNEYPNIFDDTNFKEKYLKREDDITILVIGDSLSAFHNQAPYSYAEQANRPCQMICHNWVGNMWNYLNDTKIVSDRFDSAVNTFTETGTFTDGYEMFQQPTLPYWTCDAMTNGGKNESGSLTRYSNTEGASVAFSWDLDAQEKLHFIHRKDYRAADNVTIGVSGGNGKVLVYDEGTDAWVEANGYQFTQKIAQATEGSGYSQTLSNWRLKMKKAVGASGTVTITFTASGSGYLFYWGTERWNGNRIIVVNSSRGGHEAVYFQDVIKNDIAGRKPDLVLVSCMLINEYGQEAGSSHSAQAIVNNFQDLFFGNREGHTTELSLKNQSNNWEDFEVIAIIPHIRYEYFEDDSDMCFKKTNLHGSASNYIDQIAPVVWNQVKNMILDNGVKVVDVGLALKRYIISKGWKYKEAFNSQGLNSNKGVTADTVHQNVLGSLMWAKHIAPIFDIL